MGNPYYMDDQDEAAPKFSAIGVANVQGTKMLALVSIDSNKLASTHYINPTSSHAGEIKKTLLQILEQFLK